MFEPFENLAGDSRVWVYQASRPLNKQEQDEVAGVLESFCHQWSAHGQALRSSYKIDHAQFIILSVDEGWSGASGCSIDGSVNILKNLQQHLGVDFFERTKVAFLLNGEVKTIPHLEIKNAVLAGILTAATPTFNTLAATKDQFDADWIQPLQKTWLAKYLPKIAVA